MQGPREIAESYWRAEMRRDLQGILEHYAEDAELLVPQLGSLVGHDAIRKFYEPSIAHYPALVVEIRRSVEDGPIAAIEWSSVHTDVEGNTYPCLGVNVIEVSDGRFKTVHVYYDPSVFADRHLSAL